MTVSIAAKLRGPHEETPLQKWLDARGLPAARVEAKLRGRLQGRAPNRRQFIRWRLGRVDIRRKDMVRILWAVREAAGDPTVRMEELFDLSPDEAPIGSAEPDR